VRPIWTMLVPNNEDGWIGLQNGEDSMMRGSDYGNFVATGDMVCRKVDSVRLSG
jgi:hypothetical protein